MIKIIHKIFALLVMIIFFACSNKNVFIITDQEGKPVENATISGFTMSTELVPESTNENGIAKIPNSLQQVLNYKIYKTGYEEFIIKFTEDRPIRVTLIKSKLDT